MFEKCTQKARRVIFFARFLANSYNASEIEPEHILLGLIKGDANLFELLSPKDNSETEIIKMKVDRFLMSKYNNIKRAPQEIPLSNESKKTLQIAYQESMELNHSYIG